MSSAGSVSATAASYSSISAQYKNDSPANSLSFEAALATASQSAELPEAKSSGHAARKNLDDFERWKQSYLAKGIGEDRRTQVEQSSQAYRDVLEKAAAQGGYDDPQAFLQTLSAQELAAVQRVHCLAEPIDPAGLDREGALNLLYAPDQTKDIDHDGFNTVGLAKTWRFPPSDAPQSVKKAWDAATEGMSDGEIMLLQGSFLPLTLPAALGEGSAWLGPDADYAGLTRGILASVKLAAMTAPAWQQESRATEIKALERFLGCLGATA